MRSAVLWNLTEEKSNNLTCAQAKWFRAVARWVPSETVNDAVALAQRNFLRPYGVFSAANS